MQISKSKLYCPLDFFKDINEHIQNLNKEKYVLEPGKFSRDRKMNFFDHVMFLIQNMGKTLSLEVENYVEKKFDCDDIIMTKQSYSAQRQFLCPSVFVDLNQIAMKTIYTQLFPNIKKYKWSIVLSIDGTKIEVSNHRITRNEFNLSEKGAVNNKPSRVTASIVTDIFNEYVLDVAIKDAETSEEELIIDNIEQISKVINLKEVLLILDRGYPSIKLFYYLISKGIKFICRLPKSYYKKERNQMTTDDEIVQIDINPSRLKNIKDLELKEKLLNKNHLNLRITEIHEEIGTKIFISNLKESKANSEEITELYKKRWEIEKSYDRLKNKVRIENFSGRKKIAVLQEFNAAIIVFNFAMAIKHKAYPKIPQNKKDKGYNTNINGLIGKLKGKLLKILFAKDSKEKEKQINLLVKRSERDLCQTKDDESTSRMKWGENKFKTNLRFNF